MTAGKGGGGPDRKAQHIFPGLDGAFFNDIALRRPPVMQGNMGDLMGKMGLKLAVILKFPDLGGGNIDDQTFGFCGPVDKRQEDVISGDFGKLILNIFKKIRQLLLFTRHRREGPKQKTKYNPEHISVSLRTILAVWIAHYYG